VEAYREVLGVEPDCQEAKQGMEECQQEKELFENVMSGDVEKVRTLLLEAKGTVVTARNQEGVTPLLAAAAEGHTAIVEELLGHGADIDDTDKNASTCLILAAWEGHTNTVRKLLSRGSQVDTRDEDDDTALLLAAQEGHRATVKELLLHGASLEERDGKGRTALTLAAGGGHVNTVRELLLQGAAFEETALVAATQGGHWNTVRELQRRKDGLVREFVLRSEVSGELTEICSCPVSCPGGSKVPRGPPAVTV
jgi:ankyrin repeat protein